MVRCSQAIDGGLDMAVAAVTAGTVAWVAEIEPAACRVIEATHPGVPNLGDVTTVDWATVPPIDILTAGYPCQPFSHAGNRKGSKDERHLWPYVRDAIAALRPTLTVLENVDGHRSLGLADVLGDIADMGMSARWGVVRAADAGAPHGRARIFIAAYPVGKRHDGSGASFTEVEAQGGRADAAGLADSPADADGHGHGSELHARGMGSLEAAAEGQPCERERSRPEPVPGVSWGKYESAIRRWERVIDRPAPAPTVLGSGGRPRLSPVFVEWMMGLPEGHVTGHGLSNAQCLKLLGNGVVPQQAMMALSLLRIGPP